MDAARRFIPSSLLLLLGCGGAPREAPSTPLPPPPPSPVAASAPPIAPAPAPLGTTTGGIVLTEVLGPATLGQTEIGFSLWVTADGLLVTRDLPAAAFLVTSCEVKAQPGYFDGRHTPVPDWDALDFSIGALTGTLADLSFTMSAPATGEEREVRGTTRHWKVGASTPKPPAWLSPDVVSLPVTLASGTKVYERAAGYQSEARRGFRFVVDGRSKGDKLPEPAAGTNGCRYRLLGHPFLAALPDGSLLGIGTECRSGADLVSTAKVDGVGWPYQSLVPRVGTGALAAEIWSGGTSRVLPLPGAESISELSGVAISVKDARDVAVLAQLPGPHDGHVYVAAFDGTAFHDITPQDPPFWTEPHRTLDGTLHLFGDTVAFRRVPGGWERVELETTGPDDPCKDRTPIHFAESTAEPDLYFGSLGPCLYRLPKGERVARRIALPKDDNLEGLVVFEGAVYGVVDHDRSASVYRFSRGPG